MCSADGRTDRRTDGRIDGRTADGRSDGRTVERTDGLETVGNNKVMHACLFATKLTRVHTLLTFCKIVVTKNANPNEKVERHCWTGSAVSEVLAAVGTARFTLMMSMSA